MGKNENYKGIMGKDDSAWESIQDVIMEYTEYGVRFKDVKAESLTLKLYISVPKSSDIYDEDGNEMSGEFLAKRFKERLMERYNLLTPLRVFAAIEDRHYTRVDHEKQKFFTPIIEDTINNDVDDIGESIIEGVVSSIKNKLRDKALSNLESLVDAFIKYATYGVFLQNARQGETDSGIVLNISCPKTSQIKINGVEAAGEYLKNCFEEYLIRQGFDNIEVSSFDRVEHWTFQMSVDSAGSRELIRESMIGFFRDQMNDRYFNNPELDRILKESVILVNNGEDVDVDKVVKSLMDTLDTLR